MKLNLKRIIISSILILTAFLGILFATLLGNMNMPLLMNHASSVYKLKAGDDYYNLPVYIHYCTFDYQTNRAYINFVTDNCNNDYYVNSEDFDFSQINNGYACYVDQDAYYMHGLDGLPTNFFIITSTNFRGSTSRNEKVYLDGNSISKILAIPGVLGLPLTGDNTDLDPFEVVLTPDVTEDKVPVINGFEGILTTNVDNPITVNEVKSYLSAVDEVDGDLTSKIVIESDSYSENKDTIGKYPIVFSVTDNSNNKASITIYVQVVDITNPTLEGPTTINTYLSDPISNEEILEQFTASDNYDGTITSKIEITKNEYEDADKTKTGTYDICLSITDTSENTTTKDVVINLLDDIKPLISGAATYIKNYDSTLTLETIMSSLTASDNIDGNISQLINIVENNYTGNESTLGTYTITFNVTDQAGNISNNFVVSIKVEDNNEPVFYIDSIIISTHTFENLSKEEIEEHLIQSNIINRYENYKIEIIENEYESNKNKPGTYKMLIKVKYNSGVEENINVSIFVNDNLHDISNELTQIEGLNMSFFKAIWNAIVLMFRSTWNWFMTFIVLPIINFFK